MDFSRGLQLDLGWVSVGWVSSINCFILQKLSAYSDAPNETCGIIVYQEEPRTHCTSAGSDSGSKGFMLVPNDLTAEWEKLQPRSVAL